MQIVSDEVTEDLQSDSINDTPSVVICPLNAAQLQQLERLLIPLLNYIQATKGLPPVIVHKKKPEK